MTKEIELKMFFAMTIQLILALLFAQIAFAPVVSEFSDIAFTLLVTVIICSAIYEYSLVVTKYGVWIFLALAIVNVFLDLLSYFFLVSIGFLPF